MPHSKLFASGNLKPGHAEVGCNCLFLNRFLQAPSLNICCMEPELWLYADRVGQDVYHAATAHPSSSRHADASGQRALL